MSTASKLPYISTPISNATSSSESDEFAGWFVVQVACLHEKKVAAMLEYKGYDHFVPIRTTVRKPRTVVRREKLIFPGYVFCRSSSEIKGLIVTTPGVIRILSLSGAPCIVPPQEMRNIWLIASSGLPAETHDDLELGSPVRITEGPLTGLEGTLIQRKNRQRIAVLVKLLRRSVSVEMADWQVNALSGGSDPAQSDSRSRLTLLPGGNPEPVRAEGFNSRAFVIHK
jgi:transcription termination/antitermination protein NusG